MCRVVSLFVACMYIIVGTAVCCMYAVGLYHCVLRVCSRVVSLFLECTYVVNGCTAVCCVYLKGLYQCFLRVSNRDVRYGTAVCCVYLTGLYCCLLCVLFHEMNVEAHRRDYKFYSQAPIGLSTKKNSPNVKAGPKYDPGFYLVNLFSWQKWRNRR